VSAITINIVDENRAIHAQVLAADGDRLVGALAADPWTMEELERALPRFIQNRDPADFFSHWKAGTDSELWDAGILWIDLASRVVACQSTYSAVVQRGVSHIPCATSPIPSFVASFSECYVSEIC